MLTRIRSHLTRNVIAYLALFIALGGTSYGLATGSIDSREVKNNTLTSRDIKNDSVRTRDIRNNDIRSRDIRNRTIVARDVLNNTLDGDQIDESGLGEVPSATLADTASNALALGGIAPGEFGRAPAAALNFEAGDTGEVLALPRLGVLRVAPGNGCDPVLEDIGIQVLNLSAQELEVFAAEPAVSFEGSVAPGAASAPVMLSGPPDRVQLRVLPRGAGGLAATVDVFFTMAALGTECRLSAQAVVSG